MQVSTKSGMSLQQMLLRRVEQARNAAENEMYSSGHELVVAAQLEVPVDTGALQSSGSVTAPDRDGEKSSIEVYFGDTNVLNPNHGRATSTYALDQHENTTYHHEVGKPHYLTDPLETMKNTIRSRIKKAFVRGFKS